MLLVLLKKIWVAFAKSYSHFFSKNICELNIALTRTDNILTTNKLISYQSFEQLGPDLKMDVLLSHSD